MAKYIFILFTLILFYLSKFSKSIPITENQVELQNVEENKEISNLNNLFRHVQTSTFYIITVQSPNPGSNKVFAKRNDDGYEYYTGQGYYKKHPATFWRNAKEICESEGAYLAIPNSETEAKLLFDISKHKKEPTSISICGDSIWIGISDLITENSFITVKGESLQSTGFVKWKKNEPNDVNNDEECVSLTSNIELNDCMCIVAMPFICEKH